jgi:hypothetical protein
MAEMASDGASASSIWAARRVSESRGHQSRRRDGYHSLLCAEVYATEQSQDARTSFHSSASTLNVFAGHHFVMANNYY